MFPTLLICSFQLLHSSIEVSEIACLSCESTETVMKTETGHASSVVRIFTANKMMNVCSNNIAKTTSIGVQVDVRVKTCNQSCQINTRGQQLMFKTLNAN